MTNALRDFAGPDPGLNEILAAYIEEVEAGRRPDRASWLAKHPELATELNAFFANFDHVAQLAGPPRLRAHGGDASLLRFPGATDKNEVARIGYFGDYELLREIGRGGMGVVYAARQVSLDRVLALKMMTEGRFAPDDDLLRFRREAEAAAHLDHPHIVPIFEVGEHEGRQYFSMKLVDGGSLSRHVDRLRGDWRSIALLASSVARAVHYAHQRGILHRDLKPANILIDRRDTPYVADFGLAKRVEGEAGITRSDSILGTPAYMAPELAEGRRESVTTATDVYGLGAILYELLTGLAPFRGPSAIDVLRQVRENDPEPPSRLDRRVSRDLEIICLKCLEKDPRQRYSSAEAVADDLERWLAGLPIAARPASYFERTRKWITRRPAAAALVVMCCAVLGAAGLAIWGSVAVYRLRGVVTSGHRDRQLVAEARLRAERALEQAILEQRRAEPIAYLNRIAAIERAWSENDVPRAEQLLDECPESLRRWEWHYLKRLCHSERMTLRGHNGANCGVAFAPSTSFMTCPNDRGGVTIWDPKSNREHCDLKGHDGSAYGVAFNRDGRQVATAGSDGRVQIWRVESGERIRAFDGDGKWTKGIAFSPDGQRLAAGGSEGAIKVWSVESGKLISTIATRAGGVMGLAFGADGQLLASASDDGSVILWDARTNVLKRRFSGHGEAALCVAFHPNGKAVAAGGADRQVRVWDVDTGDEIRRFRAATARIDGLAYSPDGSKIATGSLDRSVKLWDSATGKELASYRGHSAPVFGVAFSPDGRLLASTSQDATVKLWDATNIPGAHRLAIGEKIASAAGLALATDAKTLALAGGDSGLIVLDLVNPERRRLMHTLAKVVSIAMQPAGGVVAATELAGGVHLWDAKTGLERTGLRDLDKPFARVVFSRDGRWMIGGGGEPPAIQQEPGSKGAAPDREARPIQIWDAETGAPMFALHGHVGAVYALLASPDGQHLLSSGADGSVRLWNLRTRELERVLDQGAGPVFAVAQSPDGRRVAYGGSDGLVRIRALDGDGNPHVLGSTTGWILALAFNADGSRLASAGGDGVVRVWDPESGRELLSLTGHSGRVHGLAFDPKDRFLASVADDGLLLWEAAP
jgi:eukaryotic-like serine/threonine-protein kinase